MIRTLLAAGALAATAIAGAGAAQAQGFNDSNGVTVYGQPRDAYIIRLDTRGKDLPTIRREISWAAYTACRQAPRLTGDFHEVRPAAMSACVGRASLEAHRQLATLQEQRRRNGYIYAAAY